MVMQPLTAIPTEATLYEEAAGLFDTYSPFDSIQAPKTSNLSNAEPLTFVATARAVIGEKNTNTSQSDADAIKLLQEKKTRQRQRQRRKDIRDSLQREEQELTLQLQTLKQAIVSNAGTDRASVQLANYYWRESAAKQQEERLAAEAEQKRLTAATKVQATYIDRMIKLLQRKTAKEQWVPGIRDCKRFQIEMSDDAVFTTLLKEVDDNYKCVDELLRGCRVDSLPLGNTNSVHRNQANGEIEYLLHVHKGMQPFNYECTCNSAWVAAGHLHRQLDREVYQGALGMENTIAVKFRLERTLTTGVKVSMKQWLVNRRYFEEGRVINTWKIYSEDEGILRGMHSDETGWIVLRPTLDGFGTWTDAIVRQAPVLFGTIVAGDWIGDELRQMLQDKVVEDGRALIGTVENLLLEDTLAILSD
ncbi:hypothetical protein F442_22721 [Phytophthora nicotianae P10297]|uniref:START domain-containing protein n=1 Tax=Phytophthora nicotianae P10297 TaxID=1317064 RepID=W2XZS4_PHYNI|nr:hypothetical protein F442_22721 [Phytophthora nicotianae P10297]